MSVGGMQGGDVTLAHRAGILQIRASPRKALTSEPHHQKIRHEPGVAAVTIREGMNLHQPVMEANRDLVGRICLVLDPRLGVVKQMVQGHWNLVERNPEIAFARPELARPPPYVAEHPPVQLLDELLGQRITTSVERPILRARCSLAPLRSARGDTRYTRGSARAFPPASVVWSRPAARKRRSRLLIPE